MLGFLNPVAMEDQLVQVRQSVVFYDGDECLGGGVVYSSESMPTEIKEPA